MADPLSALLVILICVAISYAIGCVATGYYLVRLRTGDDLRKLNSGSTGARNVSRTLGKTGFLFTLLGDMLKGAAAVGLARYLEVGEWGVGLALLAVVLGHIFPIQLGFDGGKGLATAWGALLMLDYRLTLVLMVIAGLATGLTRQATLCMMGVAAVAPVIAFAMGHPPATIFGVAAVALIIIWAHRTNIQSTIQKIS